MVVEYNFVWYYLVIFYYHVKFDVCPSLRLLCSINKLVGITLLMCQAFFYWSRGVVIILFGKPAHLKNFGAGFLFLIRKFAWFCILVRHSWVMKKVMMKKRLRWVKCKGTTPLDGSLEELSKFKQQIEIQGKRMKASCILLCGKIDDWTINKLHWYQKVILSC